MAKIHQLIKLVVCKVTRRAIDLGKLVLERLDRLESAC